MPDEKKTLGRRHRLLQPIFTKFLPCARLQARGWHPAGSCTEQACPQEMTVWGGTRREQMLGQGRGRVANGQ